MGGGRGQTNAPGKETGGARWRRTTKKKQRTKPTNAPGEEIEEAGNNTATNGGRLGRNGPARDAGEVPDLGGMGAQKGKTPPPLQPSASPCACVVLASCLRHACYKGKTTRAPPPPPHTPLPPRGRGMTVAERGPPAEDKAAGWGGSRERVRDGPHDCAQREHAPCKPQLGDHRGCDRRVGRGTTGATRQGSSPPAEGQVPRLMPALCSRRAYARGQAARKPPPPPERGDSKGTWGGAEDRSKRRGERRVASAGGKKREKRRTPTRQSRGRQQGQTGHDRNQEARQGARERGTPLGKGAGRQGPTPQRTGGGWGGKSPQKTLVRYPTSGVWGPPGVRIGPT